MKKLKIQNLKIEIIIITTKRIRGKTRKVNEN